MEDEEALQTGALVGQLTDPVEDEVDDLLADGVVAAGVVVGSVLLASDELLGVEELTVGAGADLVCSKGALPQVVVNQVRMLRKTDDLLQHCSLHREHLNRNTL